MNNIIRSARQAARHPGKAPSKLTSLLPYVAAAFIGAVSVTGWFMLDDFQALATTQTSFSICRAQPYENCVIDGDTFYLGGQSIRIADIDAPETHPARCPYEAELGEQATHRLREILNARPFELRNSERDEDIYGRKLRVIAQNGYSVGGMLVMEGLARPWTGKRSPWCT
jgi:micrococcal nuclease